MSTLGPGASGQSLEVRDLAELAPVELLDLAAGGVRDRRAAEVADLRVVAAWAVVHSTDPRRDPVGGGRVWAEDRLVRLGGEGTPGVREFSIGDLAAARQVHPRSCEQALADVLDLQHRLPSTWAQVETLGCEPWLARKVARLSHALPAATVGIVDVAVAEAIATQSPSRVLAICAAKVIEADPATHAAKVEAQRRRRYVALSRVDERGLRLVIARVNAGDAVWVDAMVDRVADLLSPRHPDTGRDELRSIAFGWLARPAEVLQLLLEAQEPPDPADPAGSSEVSRATAFPADLLDTLRAVEPARLRPRVELFVHLTDLAVAGLVPPVARVEGIGPMLADHHLFAGCRVKVTPVVDLNDRVDVNCYEHPAGLGRRVRLTTPGDYFPYATAVPGLAGRADLDHPTPYDDQGPPGQTGTHNSGPMGRRHHRWKTHGGYRSRQCGRGRYVWRTPYGRHYLVDQAGTHPIDPAQGAMMLEAPDGVDLYFADLRLEARLD